VSSEYLNPDPMPVDTQLMKDELAWSWPKFWIGWAKLLMNHCLWVWIVFTAVGISVLKYGKDSVVDIIVASGWVGVTAIYMLGVQGFNRFLANSKADVNIKAGVK